jgi:hypothetical protein
MAGRAMDGMEYIGNFDERLVEIKKGNGYLTTARELRKIIFELPLTDAQFKTLLNALGRHVATGRAEAYRQGCMDTMERVNLILAQPSSPV